MAGLPTLPPMTMNSARGAASSVFSKDVVFAIGIVIILMFMLVPIPAWLLDMGLSISITLSILVLMTVLFIQRPLDFTTFPTVLLITTALRLGLNIATTRLILTGGHNGDDAAGHIIQAFGHFMIQNNYVVGGIIFAILVTVNFIVITKGSGRIAEVAARFSLDAMPGKQMAIDSDLSAGIIDEQDAKKRRADLQAESTFFGAMDGAAKFVKGDAIAALLVTFINIIGGIIIGTVSKDMSLADAASTYTLLTIGDGLVSQIPALIISVGAGLLVSKAGVEGTADAALVDQFARYPRAIAVSSGIMLLIAMIPGIPAWPFVFLSAGTGSVAYMLIKRQDVIKDKASQDIADAARAKPMEEPISKSLAMDTIRLELGYGLLSLVQGEGNRLTNQVKGLRRQLAEDMGYILPSVRIQDNLQLPSNTYVVRLREIEAGRGEVRPNMLLCMDPSGQPMTLPGENTIEPTFGLPAMWIDERHREEAHFRGYTVVDAGTVITTHLTEIIKDHMSDLLSYTETQRLLDELAPEYQKLVGDVVPSQLTITALQRVLQNLVAERVSVRNLPTILEGVAEAASYTKNVGLITEHVRARLARQLCDTNTNSQGFVPLLTLSPKWEQSFADSLIGTGGEDRQLAMPPSHLQEFIGDVRKAYEKFTQIGESPVLLCSAAIRPYVRSVVERFRSHTVVMSQTEIHPRAKIKTLGQV